MLILIVACFLAPDTQAYLLVCWFIEGVCNSFVGCSLCQLGENNYEPFLLRNIPEKELSKMVFLICINSIVMFISIFHPRISRRLYTRGRECSWVSGQGLSGEFCT